MSPIFLTACVNGIRYSSPMPPWPILAVTSYGPRREPGLRAIGFQSMCEGEYTPGRDLLGEVLTIAPRPACEAEGDFVGRSRRRVPEGPLSDATRRYPRSTW